MLKSNIFLAIETKASPKFSQIKTILPLNHFLLLSLIGKENDGVEYLTIQKNLQSLSIDQLQRLGLNRSENALYHVLSRMIKQGLINSQSQGFQQPVKYCVTQLGTEYLQTTWACMELWQIQYNQTKSYRLTILDQSKMNKSPFPNQKKEYQIENDPNEIQIIQSKWLRILWENWCADSDDYPDEYPVEFIRFAQKEIPSLLRQLDAMKRQEQIQTALINEFGESRKYPLGTNSIQPLIQKLEQPFSMEK